MNVGVGIGASFALGKSAPSVPKPNLLQGLSWVAGPSTTLSVAAGKARGTIGGGGVNPRIWKNATGLTNGVQYLLNGKMYLGTCWTVRLRVSTNSGLVDGNLYELIDSSPEFLFFSVPFTMSGTSLFLGIVGTSGVDAQYAEIDDAFSLTVA